MSHLLQLTQEGRPAAFVRRVGRDGSLVITYERSRARVFLKKDPAALAQARSNAANWLPPATADYVVEGV